MRRGKSIHSTQFLSNYYGKGIAKHYVEIQAFHDLGGGRVVRQNVKAVLSSQGLLSPEKGRVHSVGGGGGIIGAGPRRVSKDLTDRGERNFQTMGRA